MKKLEGNLWKYFLYILTQRRNVIPLVSLLFPTIPNSTAQPIGLFTGIGALASFLIEIPSGYVGDKFGHKRTLVLAKLFMIASTLCYIFADSLAFFIVAAIFLAAGFAFQSGTDNAFLHDTLIALKREKEFARLSSKISGYVSLVSAFIIIGLPFLTEVSIRLPFVAMLVIDIIGFFVALSLVTPPQAVEIAEVNTRTMFTVIRTAAKKGFFPAAIFCGIISGFLISDFNFRYPYLHSLGYPIALIGFVMGLSRFFWFVFSHKAHWIENLGLRRVFFYNMFLFPVFYVTIAALSQPYVIGLLYSILLGYFWVYMQVCTGFFLDKFIASKRYKATMLSVLMQVGHVFEAVVAFTAGFVMQRSFKLGFLSMGVAMFVLLVPIYWYMSRQEYLE